MPNLRRISDWEVVESLNDAVDRKLKTAPTYSPLVVAYETVCRAARMTSPMMQREMNKAMGTKYNANMIGKWRRGERSTPRNVERYMRRVILEAAFGEKAPLLLDVIEYDFQGGNDPQEEEAA